MGTLRGVGEWGGEERHNSLTEQVKMRWGSTQEVATAEAFIVLWPEEADGKGHVVPRTQ